jgi:hypothetical protein
VREQRSGHLDTDESGADRCRLTFLYRRPIYGDWIHLEVAPELEWRDEDDWETVSRLRVGVETAFWSAGER